MNHENWQARTRQLNGQVAAMATYSRRADANGVLKLAEERLQSKPTACKSRSALPRSGKLRFSGW